MQHGFLTVDDQGVSGVVAALEPHHRCRIFSQQIYYFALAFVAPLCADDDYIFAHVGFLVPLQ